MRRKILRPHLEWLESRLALAADLVGIGPEGPDPTPPEAGFGEYQLPDDYVSDHLNLGPDEPGPESWSETDLTELAEDLDP